MTEGKTSDSRNDSNDGWPRGAAVRYLHTRRLSAPHAARYWSHEGRARPPILEQSAHAGFERADVTPMNIQAVIGLAVTMAIFYFVTSYRQRDPDGFISAYRVGVTIALVGVLLLLVPQVRAYTNLLTRATKESRRMAAPPQRPPPHKLTSTDVETGYLNARMVSPQSALRCTAAVRDWDYVCSYMPPKSKTRVAFGVLVDETRVLQTSPAVSDGTNLPAPARRQ